MSLLIINMIINSSRWLSGSPKTKIKCLSWDFLGIFNKMRISYTRSSSRYAALLLGPCGAGTLASRAGGPSAPMGGLRPHGSALRAQISQICDGKSPLNQPALSQPALIVSDPVQISQIRYGKSPLSWPFSVTNLGNPDRV